MSKTLSILFLVFASFSFICILGFYSTDLSASRGWAFIGSIIAFGFSITALSQSYKIKSIQKTMSVFGVVWSSICMIFVFSFANDYEAAGGWGMLSMLYAIPFSIVLLVKGRTDDATPNSSEDNFKKIKELHELYKSGALTEDEFSKKKSELL